MGRRESLDLKSINRQHICSEILNCVATVIIMTKCCYVPTVIKAEKLHFLDVILPLPLPLPLLPLFSL